MVQKASDYYRFCADQPTVLISDSVCTSRRKTHYHLCAGCRFNDDERGWLPSTQRPEIPSDNATSDPPIKMPPTSDRP